MDPNNQNLPQTDQPLDSSESDVPPHRPGDMFEPSSTNNLGVNPAQPTILSGAGHTNPPAGRKRKWLLLAILAILVLGASSVVAFKLGKSSGTATNGQDATVSTNSNSAYQNVIDKFIQAMRDKDKQTADSLETSALQTSTKTDADTTSFYDACQSSDILCPGYFTNAYINNAVKVTQDYTARDGTKGKETVYTTVTSSSDSSSSSDSILTIAAIPVGSSYLIDFVNTASSSTVNSNPSD